MPNKCLYDNCNKQPIFNYINKKQALYCKSHKLDEMIDIKNKKCIHNNCNKQPVFNYTDKKQALYCKSHKLDEMIDIKHNKCIHINCNTRPLFNYNYEIQALYCTLHKLDGMIDIKSKKCVHVNCNTIPTFNFINEKQALYCTLHKLDRMIDIKHKKCVHINCNTRPTFNFINEIHALYCTLHKLDGMIDIKSKKCVHINCNTRPTFNFINEKQALYCTLHKLDGMIDINHKKCVHDNCNTVARYGFLFEKKTHCRKHRTLNMYANNNPKCEKNNCKNNPYYTNNNTSYPQRCEDHKLTDDINIIERKCSNCNLEYFIPENQNICNDCSDFKAIKNKKEDRIKSILEANGIEFTHDKIIQDNTVCSQKRPDFVIDKGTYKIIVEVDENQHKSYDKSCEENRMKQIYFDLGGYNTIYIRYNPDNYLNSSNEKILANNYRSREKHLIDLLNRFNNVNEIKEPIRVYYLFYDNYNMIPKKIILDPYNNYQNTF